MASLRDDAIHRKGVGQFFLWLMKPDIVLLLDLNEEEALIRGRETPGLYYLSLRRPLYQKIALDLQIPTIDSSKPFSVVHEEILTYTEGIL
jgi:thymidylate kinase